MYPKIIGLVGRYRVGKDTVAEYIIEQFNEYKIERLSNPLKKAVCNLYNFTPEQVESNQKEEIDKRYGFTPREAIVSLTNYMMSIMDVDHFTKLLYNKYDTGDTSKYIILPDIRYPHDIDEVKKRGGIVIKIKRLSTFSFHDHEYIVDSLKADYYIDNDGTIDDLHNKVKEILEKYK